MLIHKDHFLHLRYGPAASMAQLAARGSHNPKVVSSILRWKHFLLLPAMPPSSHRVHRLRQDIMALLPTAPLS